LGVSSIERYDVKMHVQIRAASKKTAHGVPQLQRDPGTEKGFSSTS
jgi:hypothetical protein